MNFFCRFNEVISWNWWSRRFEPYKLYKIPYKCIDLDQVVKDCKIVPRKLFPDKYRWLLLGHCWILSRLEFQQDSKSRLCQQTVVFNICIFWNPITCAEIDSMHIFNTFVSYQASLRCMLFPLLHWTICTSRLLFMIQVPYVLVFSITRVR